MNDLIRKIIAGNDIEHIFRYVLTNIYKNGPTNITDLEILCYLSVYQKEIFSNYQNRILKYMGLYYKNVITNTLPEVIFGMYAKHIKSRYHYDYTPIQANIVDRIDENNCFSFSAPTSTGKSYVFRNLIYNSQNDVIIVVPSRALINEYFCTLCELIKEKDVNILTFIDKINLKRAKRSIFIVTPERCKELFRQKDDFNVEIFLFDEAQLSNEESSRGLFFDSIIRRAQKAYPSAKFIFAHPFVKNPNAQIIKNHFDYEKSDSICYQYRNVGQMFYVYDKEKYYHFGLNKDIMGKHKQICEFDPIERTLECGGSILVYATKSSIYNKKVFSEFKKYISMCHEITDKDAKKYINQKLIAFLCIL